MSDPRWSEERWRRVDEILAQVLDTPPDERQAAVERACAGNLELRRELEGLLHADEQARSFLEPALASLEISTGARSGPPDAAIGAGLEPGTLLGGRYHIEEDLGRGAMGAVYRARDLVLQTRVAVKVFNPQLLACAPTATGSPMSCRWP